MEWKRECSLYRSILIAAVQNRREIAVKSKILSYPSILDYKFSSRFTGALTIHHDFIKKHWFLYIAGYTKSMKNICLLKILKRECGIPWPVKDVGTHGNTTDTTQPTCFNKTVPSEPADFTYFALDLCGEFKWVLLLSQGTLLYGIWK